MNSKNRKSMKSFETINDKENKRNFIKDLLKIMKARSKRWASKMLSFSMILCLLALSTPAAPKLIVEEGVILKQNIVIAFKTNDWFAWLSRGLKTAKQETQEERNAAVSKIVINSNEAVYMTGKEVSLFAVPYDRNDNPVSGVRLEWEVEDSNGNRQEIADEVFTAKNEGEYKVTVRGGGQEAVGKIFIKSPSDSYWNNVNKNAQQMLPFEEWNVDNVRHARSIKNIRGNSPGKPKGKTNFNIAAPVFSMPGRGLNVDLSLYYNSLVWSRIDQDISYDMDKDWVSPGWNVGFGKIINVINGGIVQVDADGTRRFFAGWPVPNFDTVTFQGQSTDGTFIKNFTQTSVTPDGQCFYNPSTYLKYPDGKTVSFEAIESRCYTVSEPITMVPTSIQDQFGNKVTISYCNPNNTSCGAADNLPGRWIKQITDTLGRTYTFNYMLDNGKYYLTSITGQGFPDPNNTSTTITRTFVRLQYKNHTITHNFSGLTAHVRENTVKVLAAIYYPDTQNGYWFGDTDSYSPYGMIRKVNEQRAMSYSSGSGISSGTTTRQRIYTYPTETSTALTDTPAFGTVTESWEGMTTAPSSTDYEVYWDNTPRTTTTIASDGSKIVEYSYNLSSLTDSNPEKIKDGLTYKTEVFVSGETTPRSRSEIEWELGHSVNSCVGLPSGCIEVKIPRPKKIIQSQFDNGNTYTKITKNDYTNGEYNQVMEMTESGYGGETDVLRRKVIEYIKKNDSPTGGDQWRALPRLINLPTVVQVFDNNSNRIAYTKNEYDLNPVESFSGSNPPQFCSDFYCNSITERGNLSRTTTYENITNSSLNGELSNNFIYDRAGNLVKQKPEVTANTLITYKYTLNTGYAFPEEKATGSDNPSFPNLVVKSLLTYNLNTGLPLTATDSNGLTVNYSHNLTNWRLDSVLLPSGGYTSYGYDDINRTYSQTAIAAGNTIASKEISKINGLGVVNRKETYAKTENGQDIFNVIEIQYDQLGRTKRTSTPFRSNESTQGVYWTEVFYDPIGRVKETVAPDGSITYNYFNETSRPQGASTQAGLTFRIKDPFNRQKWHRTDADGNIVEIIEPDPDGDGSVATNGFVTRYTYDKLKRLIQIDQGVQLRKFKYDSLGRLTQQKMAETKATLDDNGMFVGEGNGTWSDFYTYDKFSNVVSYKDARGVITNYSYQDPSNTAFPVDPLNRIFSVSYNTNGATDVLPSPTVNYTYETSNNPSRVKTITTAGVSLVEMGYDTLGRVNEKKTTLLSRPNQPLLINYSYDSLNRVTDIDYPTQHGANGLRKKVHYDFDQSGRTTALKVDNVNYASEFVYNNFNQVKSVKIGPSGANQSTEINTYNPQTALLERQQVLRSSNYLLDLSYEYQQCSCSTGGSGQIKKIVNNLDRNKDKAYEYDALARLKKVTGGVNNTWSQAYTYDRYGNRTGVSVLGVETLTGDNLRTGGKSQQDDIIESILPTSSLPTAGKLLPNIPDLRKVNKTADKTEDSEFSNIKLENDDFSGKSEQKNQRVTEKPEYSRNEISSANLPPNKTPFDFDYDGKADYSVFRKGTGDWLINQSGNNQNLTVPFGISTDQIAPADYDGDGKTDVAVWRPSSGDWYILYSSNATVGIIHWGAKGDSIMPADYDGDGKADLTIWRPSTAEWYFLRSSDLGYSSTQFGNQQFGDIPISADYDGDGKADFGVWRPSTGTWYISQSSNQQVITPQFGMSGDVPVPAKYDSDNKDDIAVWRPSTGTWYVLQSTNAQAVSAALGSQQSGDIPVSADYDGDGKADFAVWRPSAAAWHVRKSSDLQTIVTQLGTSGNIAVPSAYRRRSSAPTNQNKEIPRDGIASISYDALSNRVTNTGFIYDLAGNQTRVVKEDGTALKYVYDAAGRLVKVKLDATQTTLATYTYGESRERLITQEGNENSTSRTYYVWESGGVISEFIDSATNTIKWAKNYVYMGGKLLATHEQIANSERLQFNHSDQLGTRIVTNAADGSLFEQATLPFGNALESESTGSINRRFTSYDRNLSTGLDYAVNRFYDPAQGRFTTVDPIKLKASNLMDPQTLNLYSYTANDPINRSDRDGQSWGFLGSIFGFLFGGGTQWRFNINLWGLPLNFGFQDHFKNIYVGVAGFTVQVTGRNSVFNYFKGNSFSNGGEFSFSGKTCQLNIGISNNNILSSDQLNIMKSEISRIYSQIGVSTNFVSTGADYWLSINAVGSKYNLDPDVVGQTGLEPDNTTVGNSGRVFLDRLLMSINSDWVTQLLFRNSPRQNQFIAVGLGRAGAHEVGHWLLQQNSHKDESLNVGLMRRSFSGADWYSEYSTLWTFTAEQAAKIRAKVCRRDDDDDTKPGNRRRESDY